MSSVKKGDCPSKRVTFVDVGGLCHASWPQSTVPSFCDEPYFYLVTLPFTEQALTLAMWQALTLAMCPLARMPF